MAMLMLEPNFFLILIPGGILIFLFSASFRKILRRLHQRIQEANGAVISFLQERLESMLVIRVFSMQERTCRNAAEKMERHKAARLRRNLFSNVCSSGFGVVAEGGYLTLDRVLATGSCREPYPTEPLRLFCSWSGRFRGLLPGSAALSLH